MPRFRFRLQAVLDHRERIEGEKQRLLAIAQRDLAAAQTRLFEQRDDYQRTGEELRAKHGELDAMGLYNYYAHMDFVLRGIRNSEERVAACEVDVHRAKSVLLNARKDKKVLETLKDRRREAFDTKQRAEEQNMLDDLNARRYGHDQTGLGGNSSW
jgi:flagellar FliJ protein